MKDDDFHCQMLAIEVVLLAVAALAGSAGFVVGYMVAVM